MPQPPTSPQAEAATQRYVGFAHHYFPTCFVCGPKRDEGGGLNIFDGKIANKDMVAAPWSPAAELAGPDGFVVVCAHGNVIALAEHAATGSFGSTSLGYCEGRTLTLGPDGWQLLGGLPARS